jgi:FAD/FMN-containing dehydrogenase
LASFAVRIEDAASAIASVKFARKHNIRLTIKNTGHDFLGRSSGKGSLALWTANLKNVQLVSNYTSPGYTGKALKVGAGVQNGEIYNISNQYGLRVAGGSCPTVGYAGGYISAGGHGPLASSYGLASDQTLEFEVITAAGKHITVSPQNNPDLYWAMSGGGAGNWAVILSVTIKAYEDGPIAGSSFGFAADTPAQHWAAITAWMKHLLVLDRIKGFSSLWAFNNNAFLLEYATLPGGTRDSMERALAPFWNELTALNISLFSNQTKESPNFLKHYQTFANQNYDTNNSVGGHFVPRQTVKNDLPALIAFFQKAVNSSEVSGSFIYGIANNVTHARVGNKPGSNAVNPGWRDSLFTMNFGIPLAQDAPWKTIAFGQAWLNARQDDSRAIMPQAGAYINEATYDNAYWKTEYYGSTYDRLLSVKKRYDSESFFWSWAAVGSETWRPAPDGRLCRQ